MKFSQLSDEKKKSNDAYIALVRTHIGEEHRRWSEAFFKLVALSNTGGVVVVASLIGSVAEFRTSTELKWTLTFFVLGLMANIIALAYEFLGAKKNLHHWDNGQNRYREDELTIHELYNNHRDLTAISAVDEVIGYIPAALFGAGAVAGLLFIWG